MHDTPPPALGRHLRHTLLSARDLTATVGPFVLLALGLLVLAYLVLDPTPPKRVVLATGTERSAYTAFGQRYAELLKRQGITVVLRTTEGAAENLALLRDRTSGVDVAFVQGGSDTGNPARPAGAEAPPLESLGSLFYEPVWLFYREQAAQRLLKADRLERLAQLPGWRLNIGAPGSGVPTLMLQMLQANALAPEALTLTREPETPAVVALLEGSIDALVFASAPESLMVQMLLRTPGIRLFDLPQAEAYARRFPFMSAVVLPRGIVDLAQDQPPQDLHLVAPTAMLLSRRDTHPALQQLLVQAAQQVHGGAGWFQHKGEFPNTRNTDHPLADEAERFYRNGPPWLQRYLPFWFANLFDRMWVVLVSIIAVLIPLSRVVPPLYQFRIRSRVFRWYGQLRSIEAAIGQRPADDLAQELDAVEARVGEVTVPLSYADELYALREHIALVRRRLGTPGAGRIDRPGADGSNR
ncbi:MAG: C4-dicarboxylate ABC transporter substrate-binding protein [Burkholderiales bacterium]|nr:C4-dicarboxylate ABC transporter substrate-binding protein [Burkholderiales bacterium]